MQAVGSLDLLGPSTTRALERADGGRGRRRLRPLGRHERCGRCASPPSACSSHRTRSSRLVDRVSEVSALTHNTGVAIAGASAVAAAVSTGGRGRDVRRCAGRRRPGRPAGCAPRRVRRRLPTSPRASSGPSTSSAAPPPTRRRPGCRLLPGRHRHRDAGVGPGRVRPARARRRTTRGGSASTAANLGGDSDTIAAMAGAVGGALHGTAAIPGGRRRRARRRRRTTSTSPRWSPGCSSCGTRA